MWQVINSLFSFRFYFKDVYLLMSPLPSLSELFWKKTQEAVIKATPSCSPCRVMWLFTWTFRFVPETVLRIKCCSGSRINSVNRWAMNGVEEKDVPGVCFIGAVIISASDPHTDGERSRSCSDKHLSHMIWDANSSHVLDSSWNMWGQKMENKTIRILISHVSVQTWRHGETHQQRSI